MERLPVTQLRWSALVIAIFLLSTGCCSSDRHEKSTRLHASHADHNASKLYSDAALDVSSVHNHENTARDKCNEPDMVHAAIPVDWVKKTEAEVADAAHEWKKFLLDLPNYEETPSGKSKGRGIVYCAGPKEIRSAFVSIRLLRSFGCQLSIEVWHFPKELHEYHFQKLAEVNATARDISDTTLFRYISMNGTMSEPWDIKPTAILSSSFEEVLFLDADNIPTVDPTYLFESPEYTATGALFWGDFWKTHPHNSVYQIFHVECYDEREFESGQLLVNKKHAWKALNLAWHMNERHWVYYRMLFGDKDTFRFAFKATRSPYHFIRHNQAEVGFITEKEGEFCGHTMGHFDPSGKLIFLHFHMLKWGDWKGRYDQVQFVQGLNGYSTLHPWTAVQKIEDPFMKEYKPVWYIPFPQLRCLRYARKTDENKVVEQNDFQAFVAKDFYDKFVATDAALLLVT